MTREEFAARIAGREYPFYPSLEGKDVQDAKKNGLVIIFGLSDDLMEFRGAIDGELSAYDGATAYVHRTDILPDHTDCECDFCGYGKMKSKCAVVKLIWSDTIAWTLETAIPHATFDIMEDGELWSKGIVISVSDLPKLVKA